MLPMAETLFQFKCTKKNFLPVKLVGTECYKNFPVIQLNENGKTLMPQKVLYFEPRSRIAQPLGLEYTCDVNFSPYFKLNNGKHISYKQNGLSTINDKFEPIPTNTTVRVFENHREDFEKK